jgi:hypothetical protein
VNPFTDVLRWKPDLECNAEDRIIENEGFPMTVKIADQLRILAVLAAIIAGAIAVGVAPTLLAAL